MHTSRTTGSRYSELSIGTEITQQHDKDISRVHAYQSSAHHYHLRVKTNANRAARILRLGIAVLSDEGEQAAREGVPLNGDGRKEKVETHAAEAIATQIRHEKAKADKDHDVDILKDWGGGGEGRGGEERGGEGRKGEEGRGGVRRGEERE